MSDREKKLLAMLLVAGFIILNFFLYTFFVQKKNLYNYNFDAAKARLQSAINNQDMSVQLAEQMTWLDENEPAPVAYQEVQTKLQQFAETQARSVGLDIKSQELLPTDTSGIYYHRAQVKINITGKEQALYRWFHAINDPASFRTAYQIRLTPNGKDDTLIDCSATIAQWFPPAI